MCDFWGDPLVLWVKSVAHIPSIKQIANLEDSELLSYNELCNGSLLNAVLLYCDPDRLCQSVSMGNGDANCRLRNMHILLKNMQTFYQEVLCQIIVMPLPDLLFIARNPFPEGSGEEMKKVLLLLLGCAVQSPDKKQEFVERIQQLESSLQHALMQEISKIIGSTEYVLSVQALEMEPGQESTATVLHQLQRVVKERDIYASHMVEMNGGEHESDSGSGASLGCCNGDVCARKLPECQQHDVRAGSPTSSDRNHLMLELANIQAKLRRARSERDEATEVVEELRSDLTSKERECSQIQKDKVELMREAAKAKQYRDELDEWKIKGSQAERLEKENDKLREKLSDLEFYRSRVEELKRDNHLLSETSQVKEAQINKWKELAHKRESEDRKLAEAEKTINELQEKLRSEMNRVEQLVEESTGRDSEYSTAVQKCASLEKEILNMKIPNTPRLDTGSLEDQIKESVKSQLLAVQLENEKLKAQLESKELSPEKDDSELENLREEKTDLEEHLKELETRMNEMEDEREVHMNEVQMDRDRLRDECDDLRNKFHKLQNEARELANEEEQRKAEHLRQEVESFKSRSDSLSKDNKRFAQEISRVKTELKQAENKLLEFEEQSLDSDQKVHALERENRCLMREKSTLRDKLEASDLEIEACRSKLIESQQDERRVEEQRSRLEECRGRLAELETEKMSINSQMEMDSRRATRLQQDLVIEKTNNSQFINRINTLYTILGVPLPKEQSMDENCDPVSDRALVDKWTNLQAECDKFKRRVSEAEGTAEELNMCMQKLNAQLENMKSKEKLKSETESCNVSEEMQSRMDNIELENKDVKEQVGILQEKIRKQQGLLQQKENIINTLNALISDLKAQLSSITLVQSDNAKLQVSMRNAELQEDLLRQDNEEMQKQCIDMSKEQEAMRKDLEQFQRLHSDLLCDHEALQGLHEQLNRDYEINKLELNEIRRKCRDIKNADGEINVVRQQAERDRKMAEEMKALISEEREKRERDLRNYAGLHNEHSELKKRFDETKCKFEVLRQDFNDQQSTLRRMKTDLHNAQTQVSRFETTVQELNKDLGLKDIDCGRLQARCDMLEELNTARGEENQQVLKQLDMLISQNQELLNQLLVDQEKYHGKETDMQDKLNSLRRQKEKLEEKIMDQYKTIPTKRKDSKTFVQRAAKMLRAPSRRRRSSKDGRASSEDTSSAMSADEGSTSHTPNIQAHRQSSPIRGDRPFCSSTTSSSNSCGSTSISPPFSNKGEAKENNTRISWAGSERAVDAPVQQSRVPCMGTSVRNTGNTPGSPARPPLPPRMGVGNHDRQRPPPPPYPKKPKGVNKTHSHRPPPPPYPGSPSSMRTQSQSISSACASPANLSRFRPDLAAETKNDLSRIEPPSVIISDTTLFNPPKTSTPKREHSNSKFLRETQTDLGYGSEVPHDNIRNSPETNDIIAQNVLGGTVFMRKSSAMNLSDRVISLYENVEDFEKLKVDDVSFDDKDSIGDELEKSALFGISANHTVTQDKKDTIWYEYGCL